MNKLKVLLGPLAAALLIAACATTAAIPLGDPDIDELYEGFDTTSDFYTKNIDTFEVRTLDNGVKLYVKKNDSNRILNVKVVITDAASYVPAKQAGLESLMMTMLTHGSKGYSLDDIMQISYEKSIAISSSSSLDYSSYDLNCIDKYLPDALPIYIDGFMNPLFNESEFKDVKSNAISGLKESLADPDSLGMYVAEQNLFAGGHPYGAVTTEKTLEAIGIDDIKSYYKNKLGAERLFVVAVGDFDIDALFNELNASIGTIPSKGLTPVAIPGLDVMPGVKTVKSAEAEGVGYIHGYYKIPNRVSKDYVPYALASDILDDLLYNLVREKNGACYSIANIFRPGKTSYAFLWVYQTTDPAGIRSYLNEAVDSMINDKIIVTKDESGEYVYSTIEERLTSYKNKYINAVFSGQNTNADIASSMVRSVVYYGDHTAYLRTIDKINMVTAEQVKATFQKYFVEGDFYWLIMSDAETLKEFDTEEFVNFAM
jgi:zinc protease